MTAKPERLDFAGLVDAIRQVHQRLTAQAGRAVNVSLTLRNWLIGGYIAEFELHGADRAMYGERLLDDSLLPCGRSMSAVPAAANYMDFFPFIAPILRLCGRCPHNSDICFLPPRGLSEKCGQCPHN